MSPCERASAIARMISGRSMVFSRASSAFSRAAPSTVIGTLDMVGSTQTFVQRLDGAGDEGAHVREADGRGARAGERRVRRHLVGERGTADLVAVQDRRALLLDRVDDHRDLV